VTAHGRSNGINAASLSHWRRDPAAFIEMYLFDPETGQPFELLDPERGSPVRAAQT
jgi:hypothetical protein